MSKQSPDLTTVATVGLDLAKHVFHVHAVDSTDRPVVAKMLRRRDVILLIVVEK
jgi:transposase